jgi:hypothetical protein
MKILMRHTSNEPWAPVGSASYTNEAELQRLLAETPSLISVTDIRPEAESLVVAVREIGLPGSGNTDLIAFSPSGEIAVVECKLAANAEIKRKVIGQALEYGAYLWGMDYEGLDAKVQSRTNSSLADLVRVAVADPDWDEEAFRAGVTDTLEAGTFVLLIAVDETNAELARTVNFLNNCGNPAFAFAALEMRRFQQGTTEILVPEVIGAQPGGGKPPTPKAKGRWNKATFLAAVQSLPAEAASTIGNLFAWSEDEADQLWFGQGKASGSYTHKYFAHGAATSVFSVYTDGRLSITFGNLVAHLPQSMVEDFDKAIAAIPSLRPVTGDIHKWPNIRIEEAFVQMPSALDAFKAAVVELGARIQGQTHSP